MTPKKFPEPVCAAAESLLIYTLSLADAVPAGDAAMWVEFCENSIQEGVPADAALARTYLQAMADERMWRGFWESGLRFSVAILDCFHVLMPPRASGYRRPASMLGSDCILPGVKKATSLNPWHPSPALRARLEEWQRKWSMFDQLWRAWGLVGRVSQTTAAAAVKSGFERPPAILANDQQAALDWLLATAITRAQTDPSTLPIHLLRRWSVPLLVGASGSGKAFVCEELARRWRKAYRRWEIGSWLIRANRSGAATLDQIFGFVEANPQGCVIYLSGLDTLAASRQGDANVSYANAVLGELDHLRDVFTRRPDPFASPSILIWGGRFAPLWGESEAGGASGADGWKLSDSEPLSGASAVATWLAEHSGLPSGILRCVTAEPLVLNKLRSDEASKVARCLQTSLPPALDGLEWHEIAVALVGPQGWRGVAALIESGIMSLPSTTRSSGESSQSNTLPTFEQ